MFNRSAGKRRVGRKGGPSHEDECDVAGWQTMLKVFDCLVEAHDVRLVGLAACICTLAAFTAGQLLRHARKSVFRLRAIWLAVAAIAGGFGIWATHFVAMLAFAPGMPSGYDVELTLLSLVYGVVLTGLGFSVAAIGKARSAGWLGGMIVGGGIAAMHFTGMAAYQVGGHVHWDRFLAGSSIVVGALLGGLSLTVALKARTVWQQTCGALLLILAICAHHFMAMGAVSITPDPSIAISPSAIPTSWLAGAVTVASAVLLVLACAALALDLRDRQYALEGDRLRSLANAAVEGLVVFKGDTIVSANESFANLVGAGWKALAGAELSRFLPGEAIRSALSSHLDQPVEAELRCENGPAIPVELIARPIDFVREPHFAVAVRDLRARKRAERQIQFLAHHDALTGLANRPSFNKRLEQEIKAADATGRKLAVLCLDLDRFKEVNDLFGHAAGDTMLMSVAEVVSKVLDESQMMARLGGDEFAVLMPCMHAAAAGRLAERILDGFRAERDDTSGPLIATSIGIALYPDDAHGMQALMSNADTALYRAKSEGRGTYRFFEARMGAEVRDRRILEHDLRYAIARGEMELVYQPQSDLATGDVVGFEALLRWRHGTRGSITPMHFIPIAEETGLIIQIGEWVLREACRQAASWQKPLSIAVNVSGVQILSPHFVPLVHEILVETGLRPDRLEIEITETALIRDPNRARLTLRQLKALGIRIAMDDFGTGYSSLSNLRSFPFDKIKIDGSFIRSVHSNAQTAAIVRSVLGLGRGLGLPVLAEGVESEEELRFLAGENCHEAQGYFIGRPGPIERFVSYTKHAPDYAPEIASAA